MEGGDLCRYCFVRERDGKRLEGLYGGLCINEWARGVVDLALGVEQRLIRVYIIFFELSCAIAASQLPT